MREVVICFDNIEPIIADINLNVLVTIAGLADDDNEITLHKENRDKICEICDIKMRTLMTHIDRLICAEAIGQSAYTGRFIISPFLILPYTKFINKATLAFNKLKASSKSFTVDQNIEYKEYVEKLEYIAEDYMQDEDN